MQQLHGKPHGGSDGEAPHCFPRHLPEGKAPITLAPASVCRRVIQHMCFQRAGGEGDLPLTYFLLLLEVLISMQNSASRQKLSLGSGFTSALHGSLHHRSHQFQPGCSRFTPLPVPGRSDLVLPASTENCRLSRSRFWPGKGFTCSLDEHCTYPEEDAAVSTPRPQQPTHGFTLWFVRGFF